MADPKNEEEEETGKKEEEETGKKEQEKKKPSKSRLRMEMMYRLFGPDNQERPTKVNLQ